MLKINDGLQRTMTDSGLLGMRLMLGVVFMFYGSQKLFGCFGGPGIEGFAGFLGSLGMPMPTLNAYMAGSSEFFGGMLLLIGVAARLACVPLTVTMLVAAFVSRGSLDDMGFPLTLAVVVAGLGLIGPGRLTLSHAFCALRSSQPRAGTD